MFYGVWHRHPMSIVQPVMLSEFPISAVISQNVIIKSYLVCVKREKSAFWVNLRPSGFMAEKNIDVLHTKPKWI